MVMENGDQVSKLGYLCPQDSTLKILGGVIPKDFRGGN